MVTSFNEGDFGLIDKMTLCGKRGFTKKRKDFIKFPSKSKKSQKYYTCIFCHSTSLFGNKPLKALG